MKLNVDLPQLDEVLTELEAIKQQLKEINMTGQEAIAAVQEIGTQLTKAKDEIVSKIAALEAAIANAELSPEDSAKLQAAVADAKASAQALDDLNPDNPPAGIR
jgi:uncharacterized coiled-coil DUF342 family protein